MSIPVIAIIIRVSTVLYLPTALYPFLLTNLRPVLHDIDCTTGCVLGESVKNHASMMSFLFFRSIVIHCQTLHAMMPLLQILMLLTLVRSTLLFFAKSIEHYGALSLCVCYNFVV